MRISTEELVKMRIEAEEKGDWARCAELDHAGTDFVHKNYFRMLKKNLKKS
jgi:hypothetical protein